MQCWVRKCDGNHHDSYIHPVHNCLMPITQAQADELHKEGQFLHGVILNDYPQWWICGACGKSWERSRKWWRGWTNVGSAE